MEKLKSTQLPLVLVIVSYNPWMKGKMQKKGISYHQRCSDVNEKGPYMYTFTWVVKPFCFPHQTCNENINVMKLVDLFYCLNQDITII